MLFDELAKTVKRIKLIDPQKDAPLFANEMLRNNAAAFRNFDLGKSPSDAQKLVMLSLAAGCIQMLIVPLPSIVDRMARLVRDVSQRSDTRCAAAGALGYLVQPRDLIPDDSPGGYGFLEDSVILHAVQSELVRSGTAGLRESADAAELMKLAAGVCPPSILGALEQAVVGATVGFRALAGIPAEILDSVTAQIVADPFKASIPGSTSSVPGSAGLGRGQSMSQLELRNSMGMTFEASGGTIAATFPDGESIVVSG